MEKRTKRIIFISFLIFTGLADTLTFVFNKFKVLETNPVVVLSGSIVLLVILKLLLNGYISLFVLKPHKRWVQNFTMIMAGVFLIIGQGLGAYSNVYAYSIHNTDLNTVLDKKVSENNNEPLTEQQIEETTEEYMTFIERTPKENINLYFALVLQWLVFPMLMSLLCFGLWKGMGENNEEKTSVA